jgi:hypothetical protein
MLSGCSPSPVVLTNKTTRLLEAPSLLLLAPPPPKWVRTSRIPSSSGACASIRRPLTCRSSLAARRAHALARPDWLA